MTQLQKFVNFLLISLLLQTHESFSDNFGIYRAGYQGNNYDSFSENSGSSEFRTSTGYVSSSGSNSTSKDQASQGARVHKNVIIGVSAVAGVLLVVILTVTCIVCCRRRQRSDISKYTAALYNSSQDQSSTGIYAETSIRLPSTSSKFATVGSHSNPAYGRGQEMSIEIADSRSNQSTSRQLESFTNDSFESKPPTTPRAAKPRPIKQRGNMLIKYENVTVLADNLRPESVPDAEIFYDNPGGHSPEYHVLENPEEVPSYGGGLQLQDNSQSNFSETSLEESLNHMDGKTNDVTETDEPIYMNSPAPPSGDPRDNTAFSFDVPKNELDSNALNLDVIDYDDSNVHEDEDIYANSEAIRDSHSNGNAAENPGYDTDDEQHDSDDDTPIDEPIYDNQSAINKKDSQVHTGDSSLLNNQSDNALYQDLGSCSRFDQRSDYQALTPGADRKIRPKPRPKPKPKPQQ